MPAASPDVIAAHKHSANHRSEVEASALCGCFYCESVFDPREIEFWVGWPDGTPDDFELSTGNSALCPRCGIDSVIGSASGYPIDAAFLSAMHAYWFV
ncbi:hypothetical protein LYSHEL_27270 [Lysobacter helvus]|uniref:Cytoplasmic protein n=2 Tax=Lysobacteraceae TaxID=32033 RepID=A0ABM7Q8D6_9GAMM|nr:MULTISPECIES: cytoplasmic protein [Lysobacter]BCT93700.1 hypothetical protein LYSCAS_27240 [Lysobacter caseinilyticus]BCT96856.1 hypothetical protein LYSHEL_27270 [Lysobacter helvus]